jgi:putative FmdB family regulatory protein
MMPLYEYRCNACGQQFELLVNASDTPRCPSCDSELIDKQLSVFAVGRAAGGSSGQLPERCRTCPGAGDGGSCGIG